MTDKLWKAAERKSSLFFNTRRTPLSGSNSGHSTTSDTLSSTLYVEVKSGKGWRKLGNLFAETIKEAEKEGKMPVVCIHPKYLGELMIFRKSDIKSLTLQNGETYEKP